MHVASNPRCPPCTISDLHFPRMATRLACRCSSGSSLHGTRVPAAALVPAAAAAAATPLCRPLTAHSTASSRAAARAERTMAERGGRDSCQGWCCSPAARLRRRGSAAANPTSSSLQRWLAAVCGATEATRCAATHRHPPAAGAGLASGLNRRPLARAYQLCTHKWDAPADGAGAPAHTARSRRRGQAAELRSSSLRLLGGSLSSAFISDSCGSCPPPPKTGRTVPVASVVRPCRLQGQELNGQEW